MAKQTFTAPGTSEVIVSSHHGVSYFLTLVSGTASAVVEMLINGEWKPVTAAITATTTAVGIVANDRGSAAQYRWSVTALTGTVITYLE